jgi:hypothetical protein
MTLNKIKLAIIILLLLIAGCKEKDELTRPVRIHFKIGISQDSSVVIDYLSITKCQIGIARIWIEGRREAGKDVFFQSDFDSYAPPITFLEPTEITNFDLPQGVYDYIKWDIMGRSIESDLTEAFFSVFWNKYDPWGEEVIPGTSFKSIWISGSYRSLEGSVIPLIIAVSGTQSLNIVSNDPDGNSTIVLTENKEYEATLLFDLVDAFSSISRGSIENAEVSEYKGHPIIIISDNNINTDLYENLMNRILISTRVIVK